ncbi:MAG: hypothetical protein PHT37_08135 [Candidatus Cloacimonetes bacterium]|nr:hypothetical protein [Candidatus Cloacimonadota bacterium]MDD2636968.1 hypothetical protein [Bacteroidales bacterium]MDD4277841.1 hypothetical protein [Candidatus Cloacimonadota bacterium]MDY0299912.1 hypothetical protein [Candidatus Cloacimonadaceae bacterium]
MSASGSAGQDYSFPFSDTSINIAQSEGNIAEKTIYVHLKSGLPVGDYNAENITASSDGADGKNVARSGNVFTSTNEPYDTEIISPQYIQGYSPNADAPLSLLKSYIDHQLSTQRSYVIG